MTTRVQILSKHTRLATRLEHIVGRVSGNQRGAVRLEEDRHAVATEPGRMSRMLSRQAGQEERDLGLLRVPRKTDESTAEVSLETGRLLQVGLAVHRLGDGVVALGGLEAGDLRADLLDRANTQAVLLLDAADVVGVVDAGGIGETSEDGPVQRDGGVESVDEELEVPSELDNVCVGRGGGAAGASAHGGRARP